MQAMKLVIDLATKQAIKFQNFIQNIKKIHRNIFICILSIFKRFTNIIDQETLNFFLIKEKTSYFLEFLLNSEIGSKDFVSLAHRIEFAFVKIRNAI